MSIGITMSLDKEKKKEKYQDVKNPFEWGVFVLGLILLLSILGYLGYKTFTYKATDPKMYLEYYHDPTEYEPHRFHIVIHNQGGETAEAVTVELALEKAGKELETADLQIPFCPKESSREGWVAFATNPAEADTIVARVVSYKKP